MLPPVRKEAVSIAVVRPSVCPSVAYIANNSRTQRHSVPKFGMKVPHLWCDSHTSLKVNMSKVKVTRPINADIHPAAYLPMRTYRVPLVGVLLGHFRINLQLHQTRTKYSNEALIWILRASLRDRNTVTEPNFRKRQFQGQRSRSQANMVCTSRLCLFLIPETKCCTRVIRGGRGHTVSAEPGGHTSC